MLREQAGNRVRCRSGLEPAHGTFAVGAALKVFPKDMPEQPSPGLSAWRAAVGVAVIAEQLELDHAGGRGRDIGMGHDLASSLGVRAEHAVVAHHVQPGWRHEGANARRTAEPLRTKGGAEVTFGPYAVVPLPSSGTPFRCRAGVLLDYGAKHPALHPLARVRDPLVSLHEKNADQLLGATYLAVGPFDIATPSFFALERIG